MSHFSSAIVPPDSQPARDIHWGLAGRWVEAVALAALFALALCLWLPFGFDVSFWADEWWMFQDGGRLPWVVFESARPFVSVPWHIVYLFSPNSFVGTNVLLLLLIFGKGAAFYAILMRLVGQREIAFAAAALLVVYPADTAVFNLGTLSIHFALFCYVLSVWLLIESWVTSRWYLLIPMLVALAVSVGIYEVVYPLVLVTPLVLLRFERRSAKRLIGYAMAWYIIPVIGGLRLVSLSLNQQGALSYQSGLFSGLPSPGETATIIQNVLVQHFYTGWVGTGDLFGREYLQYAALAAVIVLVVLFSLARLARINSELRRRDGVWLIVGGLGVLLLGFAVYLATDLRNSTDRTHFYSSLGAATAVTAVGYFVMRYVPGRRLVFPICIAFLVSIGMIRTLERHAVYWRMAGWQLPVLRQLVEQFPHLTPATGIIIFDGTPERKLLQTFTSSSFYFRGALTLIYSEPTLNGAICYPSSERWETFLEACVFSETEFTLDDAAGAIGWSKPYDELIVMRYIPEGDFILVTDLDAYTEQVVQGYAPTSRFEADGQLPLRAVTMLGMSPQDSRNSP